MNYTSFHRNLYIGDTISDDINSPGPSDLIAGNIDAGYYGEVDSSELITGDSLSSSVGISQGNTVTNTPNWIKCSSGGAIIYIAKMPIRNSISWDTLNNAGVVFGTKEITYNDLTYKVRLLRACDQNPGSEGGGELTDLFTKTIDGSWDNFDALDVVTATARWPWAQETITNDSNHRAAYGGDEEGYVFNDGQDRDRTFSWNCWRPVLELIG